MATPPQLAHLFNELTRAMQRLNIDLLERKDYTRAQEATRLLEQLGRLEDQVRALEQGNVAMELPQPLLKAPSGSQHPTDEFPKYERVSDTLVKTGLKRDKRGTYEQRMPLEEVNEVLAVIASLAATKKKFSAAAIKKELELADYKIYLALGLLDRLGWVSTLQRGTYTVTSNQLQESLHPMDQVWQSLPEGTSQ